MADCATSVGVSVGSRCSFELSYTVVNTLVVISVDFGPAEYAIGSPVVISADLVWAYSEAIEIVSSCTIFDASEVT